MTDEAHTQRLEAAIAASGLSKSEICRRAGIANSTLIRILKGEVSPTLRTLNALEEAMKPGGEKPRPAA